MQLDQNVIVRFEKDCCWVYNGDNGGLIEIDKDAYERLVIEDRKDDPAYSSLYEWLYNNRFLVDKTKVSPENGEFGVLNNFNEPEGFFDLRSDINPLNVLWAITPVCNLHCIYCFPDVKSHIPDFDRPCLQNLLRIADKIVESKVLKVTLSGGECLLDENIWHIVARLKKGGITVAIISNGKTISDHAVENLQRHHVVLGISLDAPNEEINKLTRGTGAFAKALESIQKLKANGIQTSVLITVTKHNFSILEEHFAFLSSLGITFVTLQDLRPFGTRKTYDRVRLTPEQERNLKGVFTRLTNQNPTMLINPTELFVFSKNNASGRLMQCPAGDNFAYIDFRGDLYPCTSLPSFKMGNLFDDASFAQLWQKSEAVLELRKLKDLSIDNIPSCKNCSNKPNCDGGCRGDALFYNNDLLGIPSRCPIRLRALE